MRSLLIFLCFFLFGSLMAQPSKPYLIKYKDGKTYREVVAVGAPSAKKFRHTTYYPDGSLMHESEWSKGHLNGVTKLYGTKKNLIKEVHYKDNYVLSYSAYKNGKLYTGISSDRRTIVNNGKPVKAKWKKFYRFNGPRTLVHLTPEQLMDWLLKVTTPETATQMFQDLVDVFDKRPDKTDTDLLSCGGSTQSVKDQTTNWSSQKKADKDKAVETYDAMAKACNDRNRSSLGLGAMDAAFTANSTNVKNARNKLTRAISQCRSEGSRPGNSSSGYVANGSLLVDLMTAAEWAAAELERRAAAAAAAEAAAFETAITTETAVYRGAAASGEAVTSTVGGFATTSTVTAIAGVMVAAVVGVVVGTTVEKSEVGQVAGKFYVDKAIEKKESMDIDLQAAYSAADEAFARRQQQEEAERQRRQQENESKENENVESSQEFSGMSGAGMPVPPGMESSDPCQRMESLLNYCDNTGWNDMRCQDFARMINNCAGDIRQMYVAGDGNVFDVGCSQDMSPEEVRRRQCEQKGMISVPSDPTTSPCHSGVGNLASPVLGPDPNHVNPVRGDFSEIFGAQSNVAMMGDSDYNSQTVKAKNMLVVFMDPDCPSCIDFANTLKDPSVVSKTKNMDIRIVDVLMHPELAESNGIIYMPTFFTIKNGKKSDVNAGTMSPASFIKTMKF